MAVSKMQRVNIFGLHENRKATLERLQFWGVLELNVPDIETQMQYGELLNTINEKIIQDKKVVEYDRRLKEGILNKIWGECDD